MTTNPSIDPGPQRVTVQIKDGWALVSLGNPPHGYFDTRGERELAHALDQVDDAGSRVVVVTGAQPGVFVRHYDVGALERRGRTLVERGLYFSPEDPPAEGGFHQCLRRIAAPGRISIAAINGACMGGGLELALACHLRYASAGDYLLGLPEVQIGLLPGAGGTQRLGRAVGQARALEMLLLGTCVPPAQAAQLDLVHAVVPDAAAHAAKIAAALAQRPRELLAHIVRLHDLGARGDEHGAAIERGAFAQVLRSPYALEQMTGFNTGRRPFPEPALPAA